MAVTILSLVLGGPELTLWTESGFSSFTYRGRFGTATSDTASSFAGLTSFSTQANNGGTYQFVQVDEFGTTTGRNIVGLNFVSDDDGVVTFPRLAFPGLTAATTRQITTASVERVSFEDTVYTTGTLASLTEGATSGELSDMYPTVAVPFITTTTVEGSRNSIVTGTTRRSALTTTEGAGIDLGNDLYSTVPIVVPEADEVVYLWKGVTGLVWAGNSLHFDASTGPVTITFHGISGAGVGFAYARDGEDAASGETSVTVPDFTWSLSSHSTYEIPGSAGTTAFNVATFDNGGDLWSYSESSEVVPGATFELTTAAKTATHTTTRSITDPPYSETLEVTGGFTTITERTARRTDLLFDSGAGPDGGFIDFQDGASNLYRVRHLTWARETTFTDYLAGSNVSAAPATTMGTTTVSTVVDVLEFVGAVETGSSSTFLSFAGTNTASQSYRSYAEKVMYVYVAPRVSNFDDDLPLFNLDRARDIFRSYAPLREKPSRLLNIPKGGYLGRNHLAAPPGNSMNPHAPAKVEIGQIGGGLVNCDPKDPQASEYAEAGAEGRRALDYPPQELFSSEDDFEDVTYLGAARGISFDDTVIFPRGDMETAAGDASVFPAPLRETRASSTVVASTRTNPTGHTKIRSFRASNFQIVEDEFASIDAPLAFESPVDVSLRAVINERFYNRTDHSYRVEADFGRVLPDDAFNFL